MPKARRRVGKGGSSKDSYLKLVQAFPLRQLRNGEAYARAKETYRKVGREKMDRGTREYRDALGALIADYQRRSNRVSDLRWGIPVDELVRQRLRERGMMISELARKLDIPQPNISQMLTGRRSWSKRVIKGAAKLLKIPPERFLD